MKSFKDFLNESNQKLKSGMVFKSLDNKGDLANTLIFVKSISGNDAELQFPGNKKIHYAKVDELNIDPKSIRSVRDSDGFL